MCAKRAQSCMCDCAWCVHCAFSFSSTINYGVQDAKVAFETRLTPPRRSHTAPADASAAAGPLRCGSAHLVASGRLLDAPRIASDRDIVRTSQRTARGTLAAPASGRTRPRVAHDGLLITKYRMTPSAMTRMTADDERRHASDEPKCAHAGAWEKGREEETMARPARARTDGKEEPVVLCPPHEPL